MFLTLKAPEAGVIRHAVTDGAVISEGDLLARLELSDPSKVKMSTLFEGRMPSHFTTDAQRPSAMVAGSNMRGAVKPHVLLRELVQGTLNAVVAGCVTS